MDLWFWLVAAVAVLGLFSTWMMWGKAFSLQIDLDMAEDELREAHATIDRLTAKAQGRPARGPRGRFARAERVTIQAETA